MQQEEEKRRRCFDDGSEEVIAALIAVHRELGPGLLEHVYEACFCRELELRGIAFEHQVVVPVRYRGAELDLGFRLDVLVERRLIVELKAVDALSDVHVAQVVTYLKLSGINAGLLVNFNTRRLRDGLRRLWLSKPPFSTSPLPVASLSDRAPRRVS